VSAAGRANIGRASPATAMICNSTSSSLRHHPQLYQVQVQATAGFFTRTMPMAMPLEDFRDPVPRMDRMREIVGRQWSVKEIRRKSYDDLQKLWLVLYKERNMLLTELQISRRRQLKFPQPERMKKCQKSMGAIKYVLGERKIAAIAHHAEKKMLQELQSNDAMDDVNEETLEKDVGDDDDEAKKKP